MMTKLTAEDRSDLASNPFATKHTRPGAIAYQMRGGDTLEQLLDRLRAHEGWGQIVGPHGTGKSTLVHNLIGRLRDTGTELLLVEQRQGQRRLQVSTDAVRNPAVSQWIIDGYEQLSWSQRRRIRSICRRRRSGLLVTSHQPCHGFPVLLRTSGQLDTLQHLVDRLLAGDGSLVDRGDVKDCFHAAHGNLREALFGLYDLYEERRLQQSSRSS